MPHNCSEQQSSKIRGRDLSQTYSFLLYPFFHSWKKNTEHLQIFCITKFTGKCRYLASNFKHFYFIPYSLIFFFTFVLSCSSWNSTYHHNALNHYFSSINNKGGWKFPRLKFKIWLLAGRKCLLHRNGAFFTYSGNAWETGDFFLKVFQ